jgi:uncharacterized membrane protein YfbV (UPF0208 family)
VVLVGEAMVAIGVWLLLLLLLLLGWWWWGERQVAVLEEGIVFKILRFLVAMGIFIRLLQSFFCYHFRYNFGGN